MELKKTEQLENGLALNLFDASRKIASERWLVSLLARIEIAVDRSITDEKGALVTAEAARKVVGDKVVFEKKMERHFVSQKEKEEIFSKLIQTFMTDISVYLAKEQFAEKFVEKIYKEAAIKREHWYVMIGFQSVLVVQSLIYLF